MASTTDIGKVMVTPKGAWSSSTAYAFLDIVTNSGSSYLAKKAVPAGTALSNTTYWLQITERGTDGNGIASIAKTGTSGYVDTYTITFTNGTTTTFTVTNSAVTVTGGTEGNALKLGSSGAILDAGVAFSKLVQDDLYKANKGVTDKRIENIESATEGQEWTSVEDSSSAYSKSLPSYDILPNGLVNKYGGKSVTWNQMYNQSASSTVGAITVTKNSDGSITLNGTDTSTRCISLNASTVTTIIGHKYYLNEGFTASDDIFTYNDGGGVKVPSGSTECIGTATAADDFLVRVEANTTVTNLTFTPIIVDLTQMFGSGNEPTSLTDERILMIKAYASAHPSYDAGSIVSADVTAIDTKDSSDTLLSSHSIPSAIRNLTGYGWSAGNVANVVDLENMTYTQNVGRVDLGSLTWEYESQNTRFKAIVSDAKILAANDWSPLDTMTCAKYVQKAENPPNGCHAMYRKSEYIHDENYTDATTFKTAMSGVYLCYSLATPVVTDLTTLLTAEEIEDLRSLPMVKNGTVNFRQIPSASTETKIVIASEIEYKKEIALDSDDSLLSALASACHGIFTREWDSTNLRWTYSFAPTDYLCFTAHANGSTISSSVTGTVTATVKYSIDDRKTWNDFTWGSTVITLNCGDKVYFKGDNPNGLSTSGSDYVKFVMTGTISASGNIMTLIDSTGQSLVIPIIYCFSALFYRCSALISSPILPATTITNSCYKNMFWGTSITSSPKLPATKLENNCYANMFRSCPNLASLPALPTTALAASCYTAMFYESPLIKLSATQTGEYQNAYRIPYSGTGTTATNALISMFYGTGGTFTGTPEINTTYYTSNQIV